MVRIPDWGTLPLSLVIVVSIAGFEDDEAVTDEMNAPVEESQFAV